MDSPHSGHGNAVLLFSTNGRPEEVQMSVLAAITLSLSEAGEPPLPFSVDRRQDGITSPQYSHFELGMG